MSDLLCDSVKQIFCEAYFFMSAADGDLDRKEFKKFVELVKNNGAYFTNLGVRQALTELYVKDCGRSEQNLLLRAYSYAGVSPTSLNVTLNTIFDKIMKDFMGFAAMMKTMPISRLALDTIYGDIMVMLSQIAKASGGFLGIGSVSDEERRAFMAALGALGLGEAFIDELLSE